ncbi:MAG: CCA tRNA nucleotidyltransferase [Planctomycetota bacterium]|nr:CCA tRNA nucleotidyltransferase [Planctomycetota bacterium]
MDRLQDAGGRAWLVGGAVRDHLQGHAPRDYDIATDLAPDAVEAALGAGDPRAKRLGVVTISSPDGEVTVATLRAEVAYSDRRRPDAVKFVEDLGVDARRRDFTANALYLVPATGELVDPCGGLADLEAGLLRCVGEAAYRLREDPLRLLRMVRFAASANLEIEAATAAAATAAAGEVSTLSSERVFRELSDMFTGRGRGRALRLLVETGLASALLPEVAAMDGVAQPPEYHPEGDVLTHVALVLDHCPPGRLALSWSAVLHDVGKPPTYREAEDRIRFDGHDVLSAEMADAILRRLCAPKALREQVVDICRQHIRFAALPQMRPARAERWMRTPGFREHLEFHRADCMGSHQQLEIYEHALARFEQLSPKCAPVIFGRDVLGLGVPSGPEVGSLLREVQRVMDERDAAPTRAEALVLLRDAVSRRRQGGG